MAKKNSNTRAKPSTDDLIASAVAHQQSWKENRRTFARRFLKANDLFARPAPRKDEVVSDRDTKSGLRAYWFPILCALIVIFVAIWVAFIHVGSARRVLVVSNASAPTDAADVMNESSIPSFDIVRIEKDGMVVVAGRWLAQKNISITVNGKIVATERTDNDGEFVYAPSHPFAPGNYTIGLIGVAPEVRSAEKVFIYISERGYKNSVSLLMTRDGSTLLQAPSMLSDGDLRVAKIDYLDSGRIVVTGDAMPRLRVSLTLNEKYIGFARVSDNRHFGLGADVGELKSGETYSLVVRMHDGDGNTVASVRHDFIMPEMTGDDDTFYTVRRGDCLWIIARNFLRRGVLFSVIADRNKIENPDLIYPKQKLQIPTSGAK